MIDGAGSKLAESLCDQSRMGVHGEGFETKETSLAAKICEATPSARPCLGLRLIRLSNILKPPMEAA
jgi:hypothetical protein